MVCEHMEETPNIKSLLSGTLNQVTKKNTCLEHIFIYSDQKKEIVLKFQSMKYRSLPTSLTFSTSPARPVPVYCTCSSSELELEYNTLIS
jgi:hypothetical protein